MSFHVGQKIVCVNSDWSHPYSTLVPHFPRKGEIYHVRGFAAHLIDGDPARTYIWLAEIVNPVIYTDEPSFAADCFRPLIERKTDISTFTALLAPNSKELEPA